MGSEKRVTRLVASVVLALTAVAFFSAAPTQHAASQTPPQAEFKWQELGARVFGTSCGLCHQENGQGVAGAFPPLAGHVAQMFAQKNGRDYLVRVVLFGLEGTITVNGNTYASAMPPWPQLSDSEIAAALDHVLSSWGNDKLLAARFHADPAVGRRGGARATDDRRRRACAPPADRSCDTGR